MTECRPWWSPEFCEWITSLVEISLRSSIGVFENTWYRQNGGVPTGGSLCVQLANISVYAKMREAVYSKPSLMEKVVSVKRYIDDGAGGFSGNQSEFESWIIEINTSLQPYGLIIDESTFAPPDQYVPFLDTQFCFSSEGNLQTDLYVKPTDSRAYLNFRSSHPNHIFSGIVFSQCLCLRRIINDQTRLKARLDELGSCFKSAGYPLKMISNIKNKVLNTPRSLERKSKTSDEQQTPGSKVRVVSTFGSDSDIVKSVRRFEKTLSRTRSFSLSDVSAVSPVHSPAVSRASTPPPISRNTQNNTSHKRKLFQFVKKKRG